MSRSVMLISLPRGRVIGGLRLVCWSFWAETHAFQSSARAASSVRERACLGFLSSSKGWYSFVAITRALMREISGSEESRWRVFGEGKVKDTFKMAEMESVR